MNIVFFTGAGISVAAGLPTYRGPDGKYTPGSSNFVPPVFVDEKLSTADFAKANDVIRSLRPELEKVAPTDAHNLIAKLEQLADDNVTVITQNIDNLHRKAGSTNIIELHGNAFHEYYDENWEMDRVDVTFFGEQLNTNRYDQAFTAIDNFDLFVSVGTSGVVYPAAWMMQIAFERRFQNPLKKRCIHIDPQLPEMDLLGAEHYQMTADEGVWKLYQELRENT